MHENFGESSKNTRRFSAVLKTGAGSSFIRLSEVPTSLKAWIKLLDGSVTIRNSSGKTFPIAETIYLVFQICTIQETVTFLVSNQLATEVILGCDYCENYVEAIRPLRLHVVMYNGSIVHISHQPRGQHSELSPLDD